jgi:hypothetical protein
MYDEKGDHDMFSATTGKLIALSLMVGAGVAAPAAAWYLNQPDKLIPMKDALPAHVTLDITVVQPEAKPGLVFDELVIVAPKRRAHQPTRMDAEPERYCSWHASETLATSRVRICDIQRSPKHQSGTVMTPHVRSVKLAPRDAPSPSGLLD